MASDSFPICLWHHRNLHMASPKWRTHRHDLNEALCYESSLFQVFRLHNLTVHPGCNLNKRERRHPIWQNATANLCQRSLQKGERKRCWAGLRQHPQTNEPEDCPYYKVLDKPQAHTRKVFKKNKKENTTSKIHSCLPLKQDTPLHLARQYKDKKKSNFNQQYSVPPGVIP